jgi:hypothetical protein
LFANVILNVEILEEYITFFRISHVSWVSCHHDMARPLVAGRGDGIQVWRVAENPFAKAL